MVGTLFAVIDDYLMKCDLSTGSNELIKCNVTLLAVDLTAFIESKNQWRRYKRHMTDTECILQIHAMSDYLRTYICFI